MEREFRMISGKNAIVTGGNQGFGLVVSEKIVNAGANLCICARDEKKLVDAVEKIAQKRVNSDQKIIYIRADIGDTSQIDDLYDFAIEELDKVDIVVNNAGVYGPFGGIEDIEWNKWEEVVRINLLGTVYSMRKAVDIMKRQGYGGKIINLSGGGATSPMPFISGYAATKSAIVRMTETIADEVAKYGIDINAVAPGALNTRLLDQVLDAGAESVGVDFYNKALRQKENGGASMERAAELILYLADSISDGISGRLISAVWDDWEHLHEHKDEITNSDIYTLRRIIDNKR